MEALQVNTKLSSYPIYIESSFNQLADAFVCAELTGGKVCIITDSHVSPLYLDEVRECIASVSKETSTCVFEAGEEHKNLDTIQSFYRCFIENRLDRKSVVVALGGGVTGDMAGFAAATYMRGIAYVQIPTTLLSQVDSSVGGKVGVDFLGNKNMVGAFYQPQFVYINTSTLRTLPEKEFSSGMAEAVKHGFILDEGYYRFISEERQRIHKLEDDAIRRLVSGSCAIKASVVSEDEKESGLREILNFGHTFGHAIESLSGFTMLHGQCVSCGMAAALYLSFRRGNVTQSQWEEGLEMLRYFSLPVQVDGFDTEEVYRKMLMDKKNKDNRIHLVLLDRIGKAYREYNASADEIMEGIKCICM